jgi:hypothetical protein
VTRPLTRQISATVNLPGTNQHSGDSIYCSQLMDGQPHRLNSFDFIKALNRRHQRSAIARAEAQDDYNWTSTLLSDALPSNTSLKLASFA